MSQRRDPRANQRRPVQFVEAEQTQIIGRFQVEPSQRPHHFQGHDAGGRHHRAAPTPAEGEKAAQRVVHQPRFADVQFEGATLTAGMPRQDLPETRFTLLARTEAVHGGGDEGKVGEAALDQMQRRLPGRLMVVQTDQIPVEAGQLAVHQHHRQARGRHLLDRLHVPPLGVDDQSFDAVGTQRRQRLPLARLIVAGIAERQCVAMLLAGGFRAVQDRDRVGIEHVRHHHADQAGMAALQTARHLARLIAQPGNRRFDPGLDRFRQHGEFAAQITRDGGLGNFRFPRHVGNRGPPRRDDGRGIEVRQFHRHGGRLLFPKTASRIAGPRAGARRAGCRASTFSGCSVPGQTGFIIKTP